MKKKRSGKKKSNTQNKSNNNGTTAEVTFGSDKHHNWSRPCSALAASISKEIFPSLPSSNNDTTDDMSTGKLLLTQQPLFAFMILRHMIEERKKIRDKEIKGVVDKESGKSTTLQATNKEELATLLDSYIDSKEACDILDNEAKKWGERDIESFAAYLSQNFDCHTKKLQKKLSNVNSMELQDVLNADALALKDILPTISFNDGLAHLNSINCVRCGEASLMQLQNVDVAIDANASNSKKNASFILCNEGMFSADNIVPKVDTTCASAFRLELHPISKTTDEVIYWQVRFVANDNHGGRGCDYPISKQDIINLTKHIILPEQFESKDSFSPTDMHSEDESIDLAGDDDLGDKELAKIGMPVMKRLKEIEDTFKAVKFKLHGIRDGLGSIDPAPRSSFDMKTSKMLLGFDEQLYLGFQQLGDLLLQIFKLTSFVGWSATRGFKFLQFTFSLLERYNHALDTLIDPVQQFGGKKYEQLILMVKFYKYTRVDLYVTAFRN